MYPTGCVHREEATCDSAVSYIHAIIEGLICGRVLLDSLHTVKAPLSLYNHGSWPSNCGGLFGVVVYHHTMFLVRSQAWPLGLNISLSSNDPCPARSGIKAVGESGVGGPFFASPSSIPVLLVDRGGDIEPYRCFGVVVRKSCRPKLQLYQQRNEKHL